MKPGVPPPDPQITINDFFEIDVPSGKIQKLRDQDALPDLPDLPGPGATLPLRLVDEIAEAAGDVPRTSSLFLESIDPPAKGKTAQRTLVAGDAIGFHLTGTIDGTAGILYIAHGTLLYAPLVRQKLPPAAADALRPVR